MVNTYIKSLRFVYTNGTFVYVPLRGSGVRGKAGRKIMKGRFSQYVLGVRESTNIASL